MRIDLHCHSAVSDGTEPPAQLMARAATAGLDVVALTDHDTADGWAEASTAADRVGVHFVPGIELSAKHRGASIHLLAYWPDPTYPLLAAQLAELQAARSERLPRMLARLAEHGISLTEDDVRRAAGPAVSIGRPHVADALVVAGVAVDRDDAFAVWLAEGRPGYVGKGAAALPALIRLVRDAGGVPVLAHPWGRGSRDVLTPDVIAGLVDVGLAGLEVDHRDHDEPTRARLRALAARLGLLATGSSDDHGPAAKPGFTLGVHTTDPDVFAALAALARRPRSTDVA